MDANTARLLDSLDASLEHVEIDPSTSPDQRVHILGLTKELRGRIGRSLVEGRVLRPESHPALRDTIAEIARSPGPDKLIDSLGTALNILAGDDVTPGY